MEKTRAVAAAQDILLNNDIATQVQHFTTQMQCFTITDMKGWALVKSYMRVSRSSLLIPMATLCLAALS